MLRPLAFEQDRDLIVGTETFDDAGVYRLSDELALVQTLDFFAPLVDDPWAFGQIAATNALSDVYAMGGTPRTAMNIVGFPDHELPMELLGEILRGGAEKIREAGATLVGGHSVRDAEIKYGLSVTGTIHPQRVWRNVGARPGDALILTKPIGSGTLTTAAKRDLIPPAALDEAIRVMSTLNGPAARAAAAFEVHACTDVTGFGLIGHAFEMADGSGVTIVLSAGRVPLLAGALEQARGGVLTRAHKASQSHVGPRLEIDPGIEAARVGLLLDAQTSGGLLLSVPAAQADDLCAALLKAGAPCAARVGVVEPAGPAAIRVQP